MIPVRIRIKILETLNKRKEAIAGKRNLNQNQTSILAFLRKEGGDGDKDLEQPRHTTSLSQGRYPSLRAKPGAQRVAGKT